MDFGHLILKVDRCFLSKNWSKMVKLNFYERTFYLRILRFLNFLYVKGPFLIYHLWSMKPSHLNIYKACLSISFWIWTVNKFWYSHIFKRSSHFYLLLQNERNVSNFLFSYFAVYQTGIQWVFLEFFGRFALNLPKNRLNFVEKARYKKVSIE